MRVRRSASTIAFQRLYMSRLVSTTLYVGAMSSCRSSRRTESGASATTRRALPLARATVCAKSCSDPLISELCALEVDDEPSRKHRDLRAYVKNAPAPEWFVSTRIDNRHRHMSSSTADQRSQKALWPSARRALGARDEALARGAWTDATASRCDPPHAI